MTIDKKLVYVVGHDFTETADLALARAFALAFDDRVALHVVSVITFARPLMPVSRATALASFDAELGQLRGEVAEQLRAHVIPKVPKGAVEELVLHTRVGNPAQEIVALATEVDADLVIVGTHGRRGVSHMLLGSVAERIVQLAGCPVLVERPKGHDRHDLAPEVEPVCPDCAKKREATNGAVMWCEEHAKHHPRAHAVSYSGADFSNVRPWGFSD